MFRHEVPPLSPPDVDEVHRSTGASIFTKTKLCKFNVLGVCNKGEDCHFAHGIQELHPTPDLFRTKLCKRLIDTGRCEDHACQFAHTKEQLRSAAIGTKGFGRLMSTSSESTGYDSRNVGSSEELPAPFSFQRAMSAASSQEMQTSLWRQLSMSDEKLDRQSPKAQLIKAWDSRPEHRGFSQAKVVPPPCLPGPSPAAGEASRASREREGHQVHTNRPQLERCSPDREAVLRGHKGTACSKDDTTSHPRANRGDEDRNDLYVQVKNTFLAFEPARPGLRSVRSAPGRLDMWGAAQGRGSRSEPVRWG